MSVVDNRKFRVEVRIGLSYFGVVCLKEILLRM